MCFSPEGSLLVGGSLVGGIAVWDAATARIVAEFTGQQVPGGTLSLATSRDAKYIAAGNGRGEILVVEYAANREQFQQELLKKQFADIDLDGDGTLVRSEWMRWHSPSMIAADVNLDEVVTFAEYADEAKSKQQSNDASAESVRWAFHWPNRCELQAISVRIRCVISGATKRKYSSSRIVLMAANSCAS